jgi:hypothetical protein
MQQLHSAQTVQVCENRACKQNCEIGLILQPCEERLPLTCDVRIIGDLNDQSSTCENAIISSTIFMVTVGAL